MVQFIYLLILLCGLVVGSFVGVVIFRLPKGKPFFFDRSECEFCHHQLQWTDLVPVASYIFLNGECRYCGRKLPHTYPIIELTVGMLFVLAFALTLGSAEVVDTIQIVSFIYLATLFSTFAALFYIDLFHEILPDVLVLFAFIVSLIYQIAIIFLRFSSLYSSLSANNDDIAQTILHSGYLTHYLADLAVPTIQSLAVGLAIALFFFLLIVVTRGRGMGGGDVKLAVVLGLVNGWPNSLVMLFGAFLSGAIVGLVLLAMRKRKLRQTIPFGPFLIASSIATLLIGNQLVDFYLSGILR